MAGKKKQATATGTRSARLLRRGDILQTDDGEQVVRDVVVVARLANGSSLSLDSSETVEVLGQEDLSEIASEVEVLEATANPGAPEEPVGE